MVFHSLGGGHTHAQNTYTDIRTLQETRSAPGLKIKNSKGTGIEFNNAKETRNNILRTFWHEIIYFIPTLAKPIEVRDQTFINILSHARMFSRPKTISLFPYFLALINTIPTYIRTF